MSEESIKLVPRPHQIHMCDVLLPGVAVQAEANELGYCSLCDTWFMSEVKSEPSTAIVQVKK
jgi:hypothetical protein